MFIFDTLLCFVVIWISFDQRSFCFEEGFKLSSHSKDNLILWREFDCELLLTKKLLSWTMKKYLFGFQLECSNKIENSKHWNVASIQFDSQLVQQSLMISVSFFLFFVSLSRYFAIFDCKQTKLKFVFYFFTLFFLESFNNKSFLWNTIY